MSTSPRGFRTFLVVWATQSISAFGSALTVFSLQNWLAQGLYPRPEQQGELAWALGAVGLAYSLPMLAAAPLAGVWADRYDRRRIMFAMDLCSGLLSVLLIGLLLAGALRLWLVAAIVATSALCSVFHQAALESSVAMLVPDHQLPRANGMMATILSLSGILSPGLAAMLLSVPALARQGLIPGRLGTTLGGLASGMPLAIGLDALTFFVAALTLALVVIPSPPRAPRAAGTAAPVAVPARGLKGLLADAWVGGRFISRRRLLLWLLILFSANALAGVPLYQYQPILVKFRLAPDRHHFTYETALALLSSLGSAGGVVGGFLVSAWGGRMRRRVAGVLLCMVAAGLAEVAFGLSPWLYLSAGALFVAYAMGPVMYALAQAVWQTETPPELQGRVFALRRMVERGTWPLGILVATVAGGHFSPGLVAAAMGGGLVALVMALALRGYCGRGSHSCSAPGSRTCGLL